MSFNTLLPREINPGLIYGYIPTEWICALFLSLFSLSTRRYNSRAFQHFHSLSLQLVLNTGLALFYRIWWLFPTVILGGVGEVIGWSGRLWSSQTYLGNAKDPYTMQYVLFSTRERYAPDNIHERIVATIISPTPVLAANFIIMGKLITYMGPQYSRLPPKRCTLSFIPNWRLSDAHAFARLNHFPISGMYNL